MQLAIKSNQCVSIRRFDFFTEISTNKCDHSVMLWENKRTDHQNMSSAIHIGLYSIFEIEMWVIYFLLKFNSSVNRTEIRGKILWLDLASLHRLELSERLLLRQEKKRTRQQESIQFGFSFLTKKFNLIKIQPWIRIARSRRMYKNRTQCEQNVEFFTAWYKVA